MGMALGIGDGGIILALLSFCKNVMFGLEVLPEKISVSINKLNSKQN